MNGLMIVAWVVGLIVLGCCYAVAVAIADAADAPDDLSRLDVLDGVGRHEQWRRARNARLGVEEES